MHVSYLSRFGATSAVLEATELWCDSALFKAWDRFCPCTPTDVKGRGKVGSGWLRDNTEIRQVALT